MRKPFARSNRTLAVTIAASVAGVSAVVLLSAAAVPTATAAPAPGSTVRASVPDDHHAPEDATARGYQQEMSADGSAVAFTSHAQLDDLGTGGDYENVYVRDLARHRTVMISRGQLTRPAPSSTPVIKFGPRRLLDLAAAQPPGPEFGEVPPDQSSYQPTISANGRYVAFVTTATNIVVDDDDNDQDILVCDRDPDGDGKFDETRADGDRDYRYLMVTEPVYSGGSSVRADEPSWPKLSDGAERIVWLEGVQGDGYVSDRVRTAVLAPGPDGPVTAPSANPFVDGDLAGASLVEQGRPDVSGDGGYVVFGGEYYADADSESTFFPIVRTEVATGHAVRVDADLAPDEGTTTSEPAISADGSVVAFTAQDGHDRRTARVVWLENDEPVDSAVVSRITSGAVTDGSSPAVSGDGRFVAFVTGGRGAHDGADTTGAQSCEQGTGTVTCQVVVRDLIADRSRSQADEPPARGSLASPATGGCGCGGNDNSTPDHHAPTLSRDGARVAYDSAASNLVPDDDNETTDVFVRTFRPDLSADPLEFGEVPVGTPFDATARLDHVGIGPLVVAEIEVAGPDVGDFAVGDSTCPDVVLQQAGSCLVEVELTPSAAGKRSAALTVVLDDGREFRVALHGTGTTEPPGDAHLAAGPDPLDFGQRLPLSKGPASTVTVTNSGESPMDVTAVAIDQPVASYTVAAQTCTAAPLPPGGTCTVSVRFSPVAPGDLPAVLRIEDTAPGAPHLVGLRGSGARPAIELSPAVTPPGRVITVSGTGFAPGRSLAVTVDGGVQTGRAKVAADGTFRAGLLVMPKAPVGNFTVVAKVADAPTVNAEKPLLVVIPTVSPADFVVRG